MYALKLFAGLGLAAAAIPVYAQTPPSTAAGTQDPDAQRQPLPADRGYDKDSPRTEAIDASGRAGVAAANAEVGVQSAEQTEGNAVDQAQYKRDMAAYGEALRARHHAINADARVYDRQQRAYADAMADWRAQVYACKNGHNRACELPTPDPANYW